jgi:hypothetical protein
MPWPMDRSLHRLEQVLKAGSAENPKAMRDPTLGPILQDWSPSDVSALSESFQRDEFIPIFARILEAANPRDHALGENNSVGDVLGRTRDQHLSTLAELWANRSKNCPSYIDPKGVK